MNECLESLVKPWFDGTLGYVYVKGVHLSIYDCAWVSEDYDTRPTYTLKEAQDDESNS